MYNTKYIREDDAYGRRPLFLGTSLRLKNPPFKHHLYKHQKKKGDTRAVTNKRSLFPLF